MDPLPPRAAAGARLSRPNSILLVHGAGSGPEVFDGWEEAFPGLVVEAVDLQEGLDVARASMEDYAEAVFSAAACLPKPRALIGWSLGGLAVLMSADRVLPSSVVLLESSPPLEIQGGDADVPMMDGSFDPEEVYGPFPPAARPRLESLRARAERKRGVSVPSLPCNSLVVYGCEFAEDRGRRLAALYGSEELSFPELDHWDLVLDQRVREAIADWLVKA